MVYVIQVCWKLASSSVLILLASCQQNFLTYTIAVFTVKKLLMMDRGTARPSRLNTNEWMNGYIYTETEIACCVWLNVLIKPSLHNTYNNHCNYYNYSTKQHFSALFGHHQVYKKIKVHSVAFTYGIPWFTVVLSMFFELQVLFKNSIIK